MIKKNIKQVFWYTFLFVVFVFSGLLLHRLNLDEVWNYGFAHNIYSGLIPYKDYNMVITPFYPFLMSLGFHVFSSNLLVMYVENAIIMVIMSYYLEKLIGKNYLVCLFAIVYSYVLMFPSYNTFLLFLYVILLYLEKNIKNDYLIGIFLAITFLTKHTVGLVLLLPSLYYIKDYKKVLKRVVGFIVPTCIFVIYLFINNCYREFFDLCFMGLFDFANKNGPGHKIGFIVFVIIFIINVVFVCKNKKSIINYYSLAFLSIALPLFDYYHLCIIAISTMIMIFINKKIDLKINLYLFFFVNVLFISVFLKTNDIDFKNNYPNSLNHFEYKGINKETTVGVQTVVDYIKDNYKNNKKVIVFNGNAYYFKLIADIPITYLDLVNYGNWGYNGSDKILKEVKKNKNAIYILETSELKRKSQTDQIVMKYIIDNSKKVGNIWIFDIYEFNDKEN